MQSTKPISFYLLFALIVGLVGTNARADVVDVDNESLHRLLEQGVRIVDLRREEEWRDTGVIEDSIRRTFFDRNGNHNAERWLAETSAQVGFDQSIILICYSGVRSKVVANWLDKVTSYRRIYNVRDGIARWISAGKDVVMVAE